MDDIYFKIVKRLKYEKIKPESETEVDLKLSDNLNDNLNIDKPGCSVQDVHHSRSIITDQSTQHTGDTDVTAHRHLSTPDVLYKVPINSAKQSGDVNFDQSQPLQQQGKRSNSAKQSGDVNFDQSQSLQQQGKRSLDIEAYRSISHIKKIKVDDVKRKHLHSTNSEPTSTTSISQMAYSRYRNNKYKVNEETLYKLRKKLINKEHPKKVVQAESGLGERENGDEAMPPDLPTVLTGNIPYFHLID